MVKNKKALTLLLVFLAFFNSPAYPKGKSIKYLPSSQDVETVSKDYSSSPIALEEINCPACTALSNLSDECYDCVGLRDKCPDDCLTATSPRAIRCSSGDDTDGVGNYACTSAPFNFDKCSQIECGLRSGDDPGDTDCSALVCSSGSVSSGSPYGLQRRGCPDEYSDELEPDCADCSVSSGTGKDRVWNCQASCGSGLSPSFQTCDEASGSYRCDGLGSYYDVTYNWAYTTSCTTTQSCNSQCNPTCSPATPSCSLTSASCSSTSCSANQNCPIPCTPPCWDELRCPPAPRCRRPPCPPPPPCFRVRVCGSCTPTPCTATATCTTTPYIQSYNYSLNSYFKSCINTCTTYADNYEKCQDRVECCQEAVGYLDNCTATYSDGSSICEERSTVSAACYNATAGDCVGLNDAAEQCLEGAAGTCFKEIGRYTSSVIDINSVTRYDFTARTGESYNVIWQINTEPLNEAKNDDNSKFYTMIKVWDPTLRKVVYSSMLHQKSLNAAFSIYGKTLIPEDINILKPGKNYQVQVHYFMNDDPDTDYIVEIKHMSVTVVRVRE